MASKCKRSSRASKKKEIFDKSVTPAATLHAFVSRLIFGHLWDIVIWLWRSRKIASCRQTSRHGGLGGMWRWKATKRRDIRKYKGSGRAGARGPRPSSVKDDFRRQGHSEQKKPYQSAQVWSAEMKYVLYLAASNGDLCTGVQQHSGTANPQTTVSCRDCIFLPVYLSRCKFEPGEENHCRPRF